ncbi:MAG: acid phosphatase [bacterium]|nr:acid phosphatase [bacterium]
MSRHLKNILFISLLAICFISFPGCKVSTGTPPEPLPADYPSRGPCLPPYSIPERNPGVYYLEFIAVGDTGTGDEGQAFVANAMRDYALENPVEFVIMLGDNFYPTGVDSVDDDKFRTSFEEMYDQNVLNFPFYISLGNHDYLGNVDAQIQYGSVSSRWTLPARYYTFTPQGNGSDFIQFFVLDTSPVHYRENVSQQRDWLVDELNRSTARWKIVFGHHPVFSNGKHGDSAQMQDIIKPVLDNHNVDLYISGHDHDLEILYPVNGVHYIVNGAGSSVRSVECGDNAAYAFSQLGFMGFRISHNRVVVFVISEESGIDYAHVISK